MGRAHTSSWKVLLTIVMLCWPMISCKKAVRRNKTEADRHIKRSAGKSQAFFLKNKRFPCAGKGWICVPRKPLCFEKRQKYHISDYKLDQYNSCLKPLDIPYSSRYSGQYCYKSEGKGSKAKFWSTVSVDAKCVGQYVRTRVWGWVGKEGEIEFEDRKGFD